MTEYQPNAYTLTADPTDPCSYCIVWEEPEDPYSGEARPIWPDGTTVERIYRGMHRECQRAVSLYIAESRHD